MKVSLNLLKLPALICALLILPVYASAQDEFVRFAGTTCTTTPYLHCPDSECSGSIVINQGNVVEMKTRRTYFLDYPCDLKKGEKVTFILSLHGGGSYGNWQRNYFPLMDYVNKYRLVVATPNAPTRAWSEADDTYLHNIVNFVIEQLGRENIKAFWLSGHSQGGMTSNRIIRTDFFKDKVDGWLSLSGGRLGGNPGRSATFAPAGLPGATPPAAAATRPAPGGATPAANAPMMAAMAALREPPAADFSFIYETGQREVDEKGVPETSDWAKKYACGPRRAPMEVVDTKAGYVYDSTRLNQLRPGWGLLPAPGKAQVSVFPDCKEGRVVADVVRLDKGHTEGLEPKITEELIKLMLTAKGGKLQQAP
ncbi:MAG: alpha/beta hydrolase [Acidobacteria bacterium]|nr:alpha/beta hydrolase [Acidobacteriota bacterium]MBI3428118.1 alpha/beta hydrolase [Acidobacteriota bacterium]